MELFVNDGALVMTELVFPGEPYGEVRTAGDRAMVREVSGYTLQSIWADNVVSEVGQGAGF